MLERYEYKVINLPTTFLGGLHQYYVCEEELNELSADGWDIFKFFGGQLILRRANHARYSH